LILNTADRPRRRAPNSSLPPDRTGHISDRFYSDVGGSIGGRESETQFSGSMGLTYRVIH
jgi:hypothetical protein